MMRQAEVFDMENNKLEARLTQLVTGLREWQQKLKGNNERLVRASVSYKIADLLRASEET